jgi:hypothetical protein
LDKNQEILLDTLVRSRLLVLFEVIAGNINLVYDS